MIYNGKKSQTADNRPIGIYVDRHGEGHRRRAIAIARQAPDYFTLLGSGLRGRSEALPIVDLPDAAPCSLSAAAASGAGGTVFSDRQRHFQRLADWIDTANPALLVIDSCVEVASLARIKGVPTAFMRLSGRRNDPAHLRAFAGAEAVLCPFHPLLEAEATPQWLRSHSRYFPGLTQGETMKAAKPGSSAERYRSPANTVPARQKPLLLLVTGPESGDKRHMSAEAGPLSQAARALPGWQIHIIGQNCPHSLQAVCPANLYFHGWVDSIESFICRADIVAGAASDCLISAVAAAGKPFICMPQQRPFDEQYEKAERLAGLRAATICRKWPGNWQKTVRKTLQHGAVLAALHDDNAAAGAAEFLLSLAYGSRQTQHNLLLSSGLSAALNSANGESRNSFIPERPAILWRRQAAKTGRPRQAA